MVVTEALARGLPVVAADVGGVTEALGHGADGIRPGLLVPPDDPAALGGRAAGLARRRRAERAVAPGRPRAARVAPRVVDHHVRDRGCPGRSVAMTVEGVRVSRRWLALREPADAAARAPDLVERLRRTTGNRPPGDPRPRLRHRGDGPLARATAARAAALGRARPRRRPAGGRRGRPPRPGRRRGRGHRGGEAVRHHPAAPRRSRRRNPHHRLGAAGHADRGRAGEAGRRLRRRRVSRAADPVRRRSRRPDPGGSTGPPRRRRLRCPPTPHDGGGRLLGPDAVAVALEQFSRLAAEVLVRPSPWRLGALQADLAAEWFTGWVGAACEQQPELAAETDDYTRRRLAEASSRAARGHRRTTPTCWSCLTTRGRSGAQPADGQSVRNRGESA